MGCCIAIALLIALVRTAYVKVLPRSRRPAEPGFAPAAARPAPVPQQGALR